MLFESVALFHKNDAHSASCAKLLFNFLSESGLRVVFFDDLTSSALRGLDLLVVIGGDGTFLRCIGLMGKSGVLLDSNLKIVGVNTGHLGYLSAFDVSDDLEASFLEILQGNYLLEKRMMLDVCIGDKHYFALNEFLMHRKNTTHMVSFDMRINNRDVFVQRSDGFIVSTPTGSTAYALSAGGPLVSPDLSVMVLVSICPHALTQRPLVVDASQTIELCLHHAADVELSIDGQYMVDFTGDSVLVTGSSHYVSVLHACSYDHYNLMQRKLNWSVS